MNPDRFAEIKELVLRVADLGADERRAVLDEACRNDPDLRRQVESILAFEGSVTDILKTQAALIGDTEAPPSREAWIGRTIGHYTITEFCGEGGMGQVYKAEDTRLNRFVALKFVRRDVVAGERLKARFIEEARAAAALEHPNICTVHAIEEWEGQLFLVMAFIEGETLRDRIARGPIAIPDVLSIAVQAAAGLHAAHSRGIVHRDIKSANIMLSEDQRALIVDFGLARSGQFPGGVVDVANTQATVTRAMMGTVAYMSPEQSRGEIVDRRTDIWSLGVVLYEMVTGRLPFPGDSMTATLESLRNREPAPCRTLRPETPAELERIVHRAMAKSAGERYSSAADLAADLQSLQRKIDPVQRARQRRVRAALIEAGAVLAVVAGLFGLFVRNSLRSTNPPIPGAQSLQVTSGDTGGNPPIPEAHSLQVTSGDTWEEQPALSPDGESIAYASDETGRPQIYMIDVHGANSIRLTDGSMPSYHPAWFPDGNDIAFASDSANETRIRKIRAYGMAGLLLRNGADPAISPDGVRIAFTRAGATGDLRIWVASIADPADSVMLTHDDDGAWDHIDPAWSPDGQSICYGASRSLWIVPEAGGPSRPLTRHEPDQEPAWSHDGRFVYFASYREGPLAIWRVGLDGKRPQRLTNGTGPERYPEVSRDGRTLVYTTGVARVYRPVMGTGTEMLVLDRTSGTEIRVAGVRNSIMAAISPDGSVVVYQAERRGGRNDLWVQRLWDGLPSGDPEPLADQPGVPSHPAFSPDGRWLAYYLIENGHRDIWVVRFPSGESAPDGPSGAAAAAPRRPIQVTHGGLLSEYFLVPHSPIGLLASERPPP